jgi:3-oxoadipate CoA-transferase alpha subunit
LHTWVVPRSEHGKYNRYQKWCQMRLYDTCTISYPPLECNRSRQNLEDALYDKVKGADAVREFKVKMAINKIVSGFDEAVSDVFDGATVLIGGFGPADGIPSYLIKALARKGVRELTVVANHAGYGSRRQEAEILSSTKSPPGFVDAGILAECGSIKKFICSTVTGPAIGILTPFEECLNRGEGTVEVVPQGTLAERIRAARAGIGAFYVRTGVDTSLEKDKETRIINGEKYVLEFAIEADFALIRAHKADRLGNLVYKGTSRNFNSVMAGAARCTMAEVDLVVEPGELDPEAIITPAVYVDRVVPRPRGE